MKTSADIIPLVDHAQWLRSQAYNDEKLAPFFQLLENVKDPEIPALSIWDMGILRDIILSCDEVTKEQKVTVIITPTYSGCPAMDMICQDIYSELNAAGYRQVDVQTQLAPVWTTTWMSESAKRKMAQSGIAAPVAADVNSGEIFPQCPVCGSKQTQLISQFSSTACKALYRCNSCLEPFDYFKAF